MAIFIDVVLAGILLFFVIKYGIKGLLQAILGVGRFIGAVVAAIFLGKPLAEWISSTFISDSLSDVVFDKITENIISGASLSEFFNNIPEWFAMLIKLFGIDVETLQMQYGSEEASNEVIREMSNTISGPVANMISAVIAYIVIFLIVFIVLTIIVKALGKIKIPILTGADRLLGVCLGLLLGLFSVSLTATAIYGFLEFLSAFNQNPDIMNIYNDSYVFKFIYDIKIFEFIRNLI